MSKWKKAHETWLIHALTNSTYRNWDQVCTTFNQEFPTYPRGCTTETLKYRWQNSDRWRLWGRAYTDPFAPAPAHQEYSHAEHGPSGIGPQHWTREQERWLEASMRDKKYISWETRVRDYNSEPRMYRRYSRTARGLKKKWNNMVRKAESVASEKLDMDSRVSLRDDLVSYSSQEMHPEECLYNYR